MTFIEVIPLQEEVYFLNQCSLMGSNQCIYVPRQTGLCCVSWQVELLSLTLLQPFNHETDFSSR